MNILAYYNIFKLLKFKIMIQNRFFIIILIVFNISNVYSQYDLLGKYGIEKINYVKYEGDSILAFYQPDDIVFVDRDAFPEYYTGLPQNIMKALPNAKYGLYNYSTDSNKVYLRQLWYIKANKLDSVWIGFQDNGEIEFIYKYKDGFKDGKQIKWDYVHKIMNYWTFKDGKLNGDFLYFDENNFLINEGVFKDGNKIGRWLYYTNKDSISKDYIEEIFNDSTSIKNRYENGILIKSY